ncbi:MAG: MFS transporter [Galactobacter sp.]
MSIETNEELEKLHTSKQGNGSGGWWSQPKTVWAVAFATMVSFMGIGLVDPILPAIAADMDATEAQTELLFTSYLLITAIAMFFTSWVSGRIGAKNTLLLGLAIIVIFSLLSGLSPTVNALVGFRAVWGLGNALFISTALSTIVSEARNPDGAIILYEAALGVGMALGPLLGGLLGTIGWQFPFFGTALLMAISFVAIVTMLKSGAVQKKHTSPLASIKALGRPQLLAFGLVAIFYNMAFFVILAVSPFPLGFGALGIGFTFCGWGIALAVMSVFGAPALTRKFHRTTVLAGGLVALLAVMVAAIFLVENIVALAVLIVISGFVLGIMNTVLTEASMESTDLPRPVASAAYSGVRFLGGAVAPPVASALGHAFGWSASYIYGAAATGVALILFFSLWHFVKSANKAPQVDHQEMELEEAEALIGDAD